MKTSLKDLLKLLKRKFMVVLAGTLLAAILAGIYVILLLKPTYSATTSLYVSNSSSVSDYLSYNDVLASKSLVDTYIELVRSDTSFGIVIDNLPQYDLTEAQLSEMVNITAKNSTDIFEVTVTTKNSAESTDIAESLVKAAKSEIIRIFPSSTVYVVEDVKFANNAYYPAQKYIVLGGLGGAFITFIILVLVYSLNTIVDCKEKLEENFNIPVIGLIPNIRTNSKEKKPKKKKEGYPVSVSNKGYIISEDSPSAVLEAYRSTKNEIEHILCKQSGVFAITSALPGECKTVTAINIAKTLALADKKVLLIDADLRMSSICKTLNIVSRKGLGNYLMGEKLHLESFTSENLYAITSERPVQKATEFLNSAKMKFLIEKYSKQVDYIIIDTPPMVLSDASLLSDLINGYFISVRASYSELNNIKEEIINLDRVGGKILGFILSGVDSKYLPYNSKYYTYQKQYTSEK